VSALNATKTLFKTWLFWAIFAILVNFGCFELIWSFWAILDVLGYFCGLGYFFFFGLFAVLAYFCCFGQF